MTGETIADLAAAVLEIYRRLGWRLVTAESCTGGMVAAELTAIAGASDVVERGFVTYSNAAKAEMLDVPPALIERHGAVSAEVAAAMAAGALARSHAAVAVSVTGIAGPGGATQGKPVGLVFLGLAQEGTPTRTARHLFPGDRRAVRHASALAALRLLREAGSAREPVIV
jgi:nicotinamide-nucleotide amidase